MTPTSTKHGILWDGAGKLALSFLTTATVYNQYSKTQNMYGSGSLYIDCTKFLTKNVTLLHGTPSVTLFVSK